MTDPAAYAAKLLPSDLTEEDRPIFEIVTRYLRDVIHDVTYLEDRAVEIIQLVRANTRSSPAAPAGEPDYKSLGRKLFLAIAGCVDGAAQLKLLTNFAERMYRLGLTARPKVEDADEGLRRQGAANAELIATYRDIFAEITAKAAPLTSNGDRITSYAIPCGPIHRAAGKLGFQMFDGEKHMQEVLAKLVDERQRAEAAEADLRTKETKLAQADAVIELCRQPLDGAPALIAREAIASWDTQQDATRQQQKPSP